MEIRYRDILLRDPRESDIDDEIRWRTVETAWRDWDGPWVKLAPLDPEEHRKKQMEALQRPLEVPRRRFQIDTADGKHIGMVASYLIDKNWQNLKDGASRPAQTAYHTLGIDICESGFWGHGLGTQALAAFTRYYLDNGISVICLQTWSGNVRMVKAAQRLGFVECHRDRGSRQVRGGIYDGLTFQLDVDRFRVYLENEP